MMEEKVEMRKMGVELSETLLGKGAYSQVYKAFVQQNGEWKSAACKIILKKPNKESLDVCLKREIKVYQCISHESIIKLYKIIERQNEGKIYMLMEFCTSDLLQILEEKSAVPENEAREYYRQIASAVDYLHERNIAHRDIKCDNILLTGNQQVKLADFGFATWCLDADGRHRQSTNYCRTDPYASPELLAYTPYYPKLADMWACGVVLYLILTGFFPFSDDVVYQYKQQTKKIWKYHGNGFSKSLKLLLQFLLEPDINHRLTAKETMRCKWLN